jgi:hypothetical protein
MMVRSLRRARARRGQWSWGGWGGDDVSGRRRCCCTPPGCSVAICATGCPSGSAIVGATVTIKSGGVTVGTPCTTDASGCCSVAIGTAGTYEVIIAATGYKTYDGSKSIGCGDTVAVKLQPSTALATVKFTVTGCCSAPLEGATVTIDGQAATTDASGNASFWIGAAGTYPYTVSKARFNDSTGSVTIADCPTTTASIAVAMTAAGGYQCSGYYADPLPTTITLTDSLWGSCALTYTAGPPAQWTGVLTGASFAGACGCPAATFGLRYTLSAGCVVTGPFYVAQYNVCDLVGCGVGALEHWCPSDATGQSCASPPPSGLVLINPCDVVGGGGCPGGVSPGTFSWTLGSGGYTLSAAVPIDLVGTIPSSTCPGGNSDRTTAYRPGATLTLTE